MEGETILCIATRVWHSLWRSTQQYMSRFATQNRVLYFEPGRNPDRSLGTELRRNWPNFFSLRAKKLHENLILIETPSSLPAARRYLPRSVLKVTTPFVVKVNARILIRQVRWAMKELDVKDPILWLYSPNQIDLIGKFNEKRTCYFNYDEFPDFAGSKGIKELIRQSDNRLSNLVDVVFASSRAQWERRRPINPNTYFIPNAVDFELFNRALKPNLPLPADIINIPHPIIGFAGWLGYQIDLELLKRVGEAYPSCSLVLVGPDRLSDVPGRQRLRALPNVFFLGQKERDELPNYLRVFNVALIPWLVVGHARSAYPLKLHEYLAAGRAIVATALPELRPFSHVVRIAETHEEFIQQIGEALHDNTPQSIETRTAIAKENTWDQRVSLIYRILHNHMSRTEA